MWRMSSDPQRSGLIMIYLRELRLARGITQADMAAAINLSTRQYQRWEESEADNLKGPQLLAALVALGGDIDHVSYLLNDHHPVDAQIAAALARAQASAGVPGQPGHSEIVAELEQLRPDLMQPLLSLVGSLLGPRRARQRGDEIG